MKIYEKRTYSIRVGQMAEILRLYSEEVFPVLESEGFSKNLVGYFISDTGRLHQLIRFRQLRPHLPRQRHHYSLYRIHHRHHHRRLGLDM